MPSTDQAVKKDGRLELLRAAGVLAIIFLHVICAWAQKPAHYEAYYDLSVRFFADSILHTAGTRWAVPVFLMISGALLINPKKELPLKKIGRYIGKMLLVLLLFGMVYNIMELYFNSRTLSFALFGNAFLNLIQGITWDHLWYLYSLIGLYILLPVFRVFARTAEKKVKNAVALAMFILMILLPTANLYFHLSLTSFGIGAPVALFYFYMGHLLYSEEALPRFLQSKRGCGILFLAGAAFLTAVNLYGVLRFHAPLTWNIPPEEIGVACMSIGLFGFVLKAKKSDAYGRSKIVCFLAKHSFCIYLVHPIFQHILYRVLDFYPDAMPPFIGELGIFAAILLCSILLSLLLHLIPGIKKLL